MSQKSTVIQGAQAYKQLQCGKYSDTRFEEGMITFGVGWASRRPYRRSSV